MSTRVPTYGTSDGANVSSSVEKAVDVLFYLHAAGQSQGVTAIARGLGLPKSSVHRLLGALGQRGLVERGERGRYRPGMALVALGMGALELDPVVVAARAPLEAAAAELDETCFLVALRAGSLLVVDKVEGGGFLRASPQIGSAVPVHATAVGKLYLAFAPDRVEPKDLEPFTPGTVATAAELEAEVARTREHGHATNVDEWIEGLTVVAAPIWFRGSGGSGGRSRRGLGDRLVAAAAVAVPTARAARLDAELLARRIVATADEVTRRLGGELLGNAAPLQPNAGKPGAGRTK